jgi:hypothetical protein
MRIEAESVMVTTLVIIEGGRGRGGRIEVQCNSIKCKYRI